LLQQTPLNRLLAKDEYNYVIAWMLSDSSSYFNGAIITVDGGRTGW
jgi:NAD(P)-dependent dehydrogenase (short-subunit alcohol dehydrogenase family)